MPRRTSVAEPPVRVVVVTLDGHLASACERAAAALAPELPSLALSLHAASDWDADPAALERCRADIARADIVVATMLFMEAHVEAVLPALVARREGCDAMFCAMADARVVRLTRMGALAMDGEARGPLALLKRLRGSKRAGRSSGAGQMKMLRRLPRILRFVPGSAQDLRVYFLALQCWLAGSEANVATLVRLLVGRYAAGPREALRARLDTSGRAAIPIDYPDTGLYHPALARGARGAGGAIATRRESLPRPAGGPTAGTVGLLLMRSYVLAGNTRHYDAVIERLEAQGLAVVPVFASGLDARAAIDAYFRDGEDATIDCLVSLTGFSLVGGPAYNDARAAADALAALDVPYLAAHPSEFQTLAEWRESARGLTPIESTLMIAIPELDGASCPMLVAGHEGGANDAAAAKDLVPVVERVERLAARVARLVRLRTRARAERRLAVVLFNFPPNAGATGTAAYLAVFESLFNLLHRLAAEGYRVEPPASVEALREAVLGGNAGRFGTDANVLARVALDEHVAATPWLEEIESVWGAAPGRQLTDGRDLFVLGAEFGAISVVVQPPMGIEGDPMRLMFEGGFAPTHAFSAFYRYLVDTLDVDAVLHFGTHGALEFMPGKQTGLSGECWPERLIGATPNVYLYAANNPSEGALARRRGAATLVSHLTPAVTEAGLYRGLKDLRVSLEQWSRLEPEALEGGSAEAEELFALLLQQAEALDLIGADAVSSAALARARGAAETVAALRSLLEDYERTLIPDGLHVVGRRPDLGARVALLYAHAEGAGDGVHAGEAARGEAEGVAVDAGGDAPDERSAPPSRERLAALFAAADAADGARARVAPANALERRLVAMDRHLVADAELEGLVRALDARFVRPAPGGDVLANAEVLPTGRNVHGFDPFRLPTALAHRLGARHAERLLARHAQDHGRAPSAVAFVLWGTDNLKNEGVPIAQVLALIGARARRDGYGRIAGAELIALETLGRARVDVMVTLSGIFRDLLPLQTRVLAEAARLAAEAEDEPLEMNPIRRHALAHAEATGTDLATAALRVFSNADGAYGANVNQLVDSGAWREEGELAETFAARKCFAYGTDGRPARQPALLESLLGDVELAYQNLESVEMGVTSLDHYFDTLGGINSMVRRAKGEAVPVYIGDQTRGSGTVRSLAEQVALETRTRTLNPRWYEGMLAHGHEGVRHIEMSVTNTLGWSATTGQVGEWIYGRVAETYLLDPAMRERLAALNPQASVRIAARLLEAHERNYWSPDDATLAALGDAGDELEDRLEGVGEATLAGALA